MNTTNLWTTTTGMTNDLWPWQWRAQWREENGRNIFTTTTAPAGATSRKRSNTPEPYDDDVDDGI